MRIQAFLLGLLLLLPVPATAQTIFDRYFENLTSVTTEQPMPNEKIINFVVKEMEDWDIDGILLFPGDVEAAIVNDRQIYCTDKVAFHSGRPLNFTVGGVVGAGCASLRDAMLSIIQVEMEVDNLGDVLVTIANGGSLALSDQPNRPANVGFATLLTTRVWAGTGTLIFPWPEEANDILENKLNPELQEDKVTDELVWTYQHGLFRNEREDDPVLAAYDLDGDGDGYTVGMALEELAGALGIEEDHYLLTGEFAVPKLDSDNLGLWARADDIGLMWIYPDHFMRMEEIKAAGAYPVLHEQGDHLAYPYNYAGTFDFNSIPEGSGAIKSPACTRSAGRLGYLCRSIPGLVENCELADEPDEITLIRCDEQTRVSPNGPELCPEIEVLFNDDGTPLWDPADPRFVNPALTPADITKICDPEKKVMYKDDITATACYTAFCVAQSHSGHTLVSNRSPNLVSEATSPYLACVRQDPHLGLYAELAQMTPFALPSYIGHQLAQEYEREYCAITGIPPHPLAGYCTYRENRRANSPLFTFGMTNHSVVEELAGVRADQEIVLGDATAIGQRVALDQWLPIQRKVVHSIAQSIDETATLLRELARAPLTKTPCPWTGPFPRSKSSSSAP